MMNEKKYNEMSLTERVEYNNNAPSDRWFPPMWWVEISTVAGLAPSKIDKHKSTDGFFVGRKDVKALYGEMGYLDEATHGKEHTTDWFEERYGINPTKEERKLNQGLMRQKPDSYDPETDSPLIGGYGAKENINFAAEPEVGWGPYVRTADLIGLLEQAVGEFPVKEVIRFSLFGKDCYIYDADKADSWKKKWLTVPPEVQSLKGSAIDE